MLTATITRTRVEIKIMGDKILELRHSKLGEYTETRDTSNVGDLPSFRQKFITDTAKKVINQNKAQERIALKNKAQSLIKLTLSNIK